MQVDQPGQRDQAVGVDDLGAPAADRPVPDLGDRRRPASSRSAARRRAARTPRISQLVASSGHRHRLPRPSPSRCRRAAGTARPSGPRRRWRPARRWSSAAQSAASAEISRPRFIGPGCITMACGGQQRQPAGVQPVPAGVLPGAGEERARSSAPAAPAASSRRRRAADRRAPRPGRSSTSHGQRATPTGSSVGGATRTTSRAEGGQQQHVGAGDPAVQHVADDRDPPAGQVRTGGLLGGRPDEVAAHGERVEQRLGGVLVGAVAGVDARAPRIQPALASRCGAPQAGCRITTASAPIASRVSAVSFRLSPLETLEPLAEKLITSADSRLAAASNEIRVRVESSKNRLTTVRPRSVGSFLISPLLGGGHLARRCRGSAIASCAAQVGGATAGAVMRATACRSRSGAVRRRVRPRPSDQDLVAPSISLEQHLDPLGAGGRQVLADVVGADRQLAVAPVDQHGQPDGARAARGRRARRARPGWCGRSRGRRRPGRRRASSMPPAGSVGGPRLRVGCRRRSSRYMVTSREPTGTSAPLDRRRAARRAGAPAERRGSGCRAGPGRRRPCSARAARGRSGSAPGGSRPRRAQGVAEPCSDLLPRLTGRVVKADSRCAICGPDAPC